MSFRIYDTDWAISKKGNYWRRINGRVISVGSKPDGRFWAMADGIFVNGTFYTSATAKVAAEAKLKNLIHSRGF